MFHTKIVQRCNFSVVAHNDLIIRYAGGHFSAASAVVSTTDRASLPVVMRLDELLFISPFHLFDSQEGSSLSLIPLLAKATKLGESPILR